MTFLEFQSRFPDDETCLEYLWTTRYAPDGETALCPKCETERTFKRYATTQQRQSWTCSTCGHHIHPTAGTIFHKSSTALQLWFFAIYIMTSTRCGVSAKQLERELGVTYKTAWRMFHLIRTQLMTQDDDMLSGDVEADETYIGGRPRAHDHRPKGMKRADKQAVFAAVERGGRVRAEVVGGPSISGVEAKAYVSDIIKAESRVFTDESGVYVGVERTHAEHHTINHRAKVYVHGDVHTQTIDGFFSTVKNGIRGAYHAVSPKHLQSYLNEYVWRYNHRDDRRAMFELLLLRAALA
jgi:transposase-like protein